MQPPILLRPGFEHGVFSHTTDRFGCLIYSLFWRSGRRHGKFVNHVIFLAPARDARTLSTHQQTYCLSINVHRTLAVPKRPGVAIASGQPSFSSFRLRPRLHPPGARSRLCRSAVPPLPHTARRRRREPPDHVFGSGGCRCNRLNAEVGAARDLEPRTAPASRHFNSPYRANTSLWFRSSARRRLPFRNLRCENPAHCRS